MSDDESMSLGQQYKLRETTTMWSQRKRSQQSSNNYDDMFGLEHMENYSVETTALHRKLQSKMEALRILRKELEKFRTERDQFKLMAETLQLRYAALRRNSSFSDLTGFSSDFSAGTPNSGGKTSVAKILHDSRERNIKLTTEVESLKQKLYEVQGDIEVLRNQKTPVGNGEKKKDHNCHNGKSTKDEVAALDNCSKEMVMQWKQERSNFICHLEQLKKKNAQLAFDFKAVIDEKEELINERDAYKCKAHRLNHELLVSLKAKEMHPKFLDIDSIILENKYLNERLKHIESEVELTKQAVSKYKTILESRRKKGIMKLGAQTPINIDDNILSHKQVKNLLENGIDLPTKTETIHDLKALCLTLLDNLNDKNLALNHQKKTNKILATKMAELEQRMKALAGIETSNDDDGFSPSEFLLKGYCPSMVDSAASNSGKEQEDDQESKGAKAGAVSSATTARSTTSCGESHVTEDSGTMSSENEESMKMPRATNSDDGMSSLSTESGRSILSSEYEITNNGVCPINLNDFADAALYAYKTASSTSGSAGDKTQRKEGRRPLPIPNSIVQERHDDLKDLPPELAALVQKALHELDLRDFDEVVGGVCEDVGVEAKEEDLNLDDQDVNDILEEELNSEDGAIGGCTSLIKAN
ncbi:uncharacterized protein LOC106093698 [Stomoxys calcitrans]|uniref:uncharacterized protein LOC106093698 n=1 Tax=Stomoxys calcitrans TaxID=35570 RepID=UPI0027E35C19|nr:uncharacterized protein LOC106093698 [Stomoxys calcitrans]